MSGNDFSRCEQCGAVWLDEPKPCECKTVEDVLREALWRIGHEPCDAYQAEAIARQALKETT